VAILGKTFGSGCSRIPGDQGACKSLALRIDWDHPWSFEKHLILEQCSARGKASYHSKPVRVSWGSGSHDVVSCLQPLKIRKNGLPGAAQLSRDAVRGDRPTVIHDRRLFVAIAGAGRVGSQPEVFPDAGPKLLPMVEQPIPAGGHGSKIRHTNQGK
jgi:hypothetical protein